MAPTDRVAGVPDGAEPPLPRVSVGLVVRNAEATVLAAVRSILFQTLSSWELLVANDGSTDRTAKLLEGVRDARVRVTHHATSRGLAVRLNQLVDSARGAYFARIDGDDFAFPDRLTRQACYLDAHRDVDLLGSGMIHFVDGGRSTGKEPVETRHEAICRHPRRGFLLYHPTWMGRITWFRRHRYDAGRQRGQDFDLLLRTYRHSRFAALEEPLLGHRTNNAGLRLRLRSRRNACSALARNAWTQRDPALVWGIVEQCLKVPVDLLTFATGAHDRVRRRRLRPLEAQDQRAFASAWAVLRQWADADRARGSVSRAVADG